MNNGEAEAVLMEKKPKTKIVCTLGPIQICAYDRKLLRAGMNVARFNFSHGSHEYHQETLDNLKAAWLTLGPEIRTGFLKDGKPIQLKQGQEITISTDYSIKGDENMICMSYKKLAVDVKPGMVILCADGTISFTVLSRDIKAGLVQCRCENSAVLGERKNVNLPGVIVDLPTLTDKDKEDILMWGIPNHIDMIALSFVRKGSDLVEVRKLLGEHAKNILLMSKVENQEGVANFDEILANSDAFMVARGDLGMEIPIEKIFLAQKVMIYKCNIQGKPGGSTAKLVAKYRPGMPILSVVVPEIKTDSFDWSCSDEAPARHSLIFRGLVPVLYAGSARASHAETTEEALDFAIQHAKTKGLCKNGDSVVALHRVGTASIIKIITVK
ncbi:hypothetical protein GH714_025320 [Hevea brasiliensis]|uniref:Pyruvate kinase n=1 Tax=Hevea brasiliensis TaxID=3981 RepID=A0A6A6LUZ9_HEVBR|nr:hypothetical protein GH714_025320 [Hevea brasiliensis]